MTRGTALLTGATGGIGRALALELAADGWTLILHGRDRERCADLARAIVAAGCPEPELRMADFLSLDAVVALGSSVRDADGPLHLLVNNAGTGFDGDVRPSVDGYDRAMQVNYIAPWILMTMLRAKLSRSPDAVVLNVGSVGQHRFARDCPFLPVSREALAYGRSKLALAMASRTLAPRLASAGITLIQAHPGSMIRTGLSQRLLSILPWLPRTLMRIAACRAPSPQQAARYLRGLIDAGNAAPDGRLLAARARDARDHRDVDDAAARARLEDLTRARLMPLLPAQGEFGVATPYTAFNERVTC